MSRFLTYSDNWIAKASSPTIVPVDRAETAVRFVDHSIDIRKKSIVTKRPIILFIHSLIVVDCWDYFGFVDWWWFVHRGLDCILNTHPADSWRNWANHHVAAWSAPTHRGNWLLIILDFKARQIQWGLAFCFVTTASLTEGLNASCNQNVN